MKNYDIVIIGEDRQGLQPQSQQKEMEQTVF